MNKLPYLPLFVGDQIRDTRGLTLADRAIYLEVEMACWISPDPGTVTETLSGLQMKFSVLDGQVLDDCLRYLAEKSLITYEKNQIDGDIKLTVPWIRKRLEKSAEMSGRGKKGGNPQLRKVVKEPAKAKGKTNSGFIFTTVDKIENIKESPKKIVILPFSSEEFATAWQQWIDYRKELNKPYKSPMAMQKQLTTLSKYPEEIAIKMIEKSIECHWQGIFPLSDIQNNHITTPRNVQPKSVTKDGTINRLKRYTDQ